LLKQASNTVMAAVKSIESRINIETFDPESSPPELGLNDIGELKLLAAKPLIFDGYATNRLTGSFILIEQGSNATVAAGMLLPATEPLQLDYTDFAI
jgi:bifunctional enzyme CysN/CysC/sulfate adenylyltransferase subunit 1